MEASETMRNDIQRIATVAHDVFRRFGFTYFDGPPTAKRLQDAIQEKVDDLMGDPLLNGTSSGRLRVLRSEIGGYICIDVGTFDLPEEHDAIREANDMACNEAYDELLAACKGVLEYLEHGEGRAPNGLRLISAMDLLKAAIIKAERQ